MSDLNHDAIPSDVSDELNKHSLTEDAREAILSALDGAPALLSRSEAARRCGVSPKTISRLVDRDRAITFKFDPHQRGARRVTRRWLAQLLCEAVQ